MGAPRAPLPRRLRLLGRSGTLPFIATPGIVVLEPALRSRACVVFIA